MTGATLTPARLVIEIAEHHLANGTVEQQRALAQAILNAIGICEREVGAAIAAVANGVHADVRDDLVKALQPFAAFCEKAEAFVAARAKDGGPTVLPTLDFRLADFRAARAAFVKAGGAT